MLRHRLFVATSRILSSRGFGTVTNRRKLAPSCSMLLNKETSAGVNNMVLSSSFRRFQGTTNWPKNTTTPHSESASTLTEHEFVRIAKSALDCITEQLEAMADNPSLDIPNDFDVNFSGDVLTLRLGAGRGTYVLNTQTPNRQIWLSSPFSGPKRFDWTPQEGNGGGLWIYRHDGSELGALLSKELSAAFKTSIVILPYSHA